jgi:hypothetical protein
MISTADKPEDRKERLRKLREYHQVTLDYHGVPDGIFVPKMAYRPIGKTDLHIAFFASEISKGDDVYVEFTSKELIPEDTERRLYRWRFNPHFHEEYDATEPHPQTGHVRYLVPVDELELLPRPKATETVVEESPFADLPDPNQDLPVNQMTIRDLAAIMLNKPVSKKEWLNDIIKSKK